METTRQATEAQVRYLNALQAKALKRCGALGDDPEFGPHDWHEDIQMGMTTKDANIKIQAFKRLIRAQNLKMLLLGIELK